MIPRNLLCFGTGIVCLFVFQGALGVPPELGMPPEYDPVVSQGAEVCSRESDLNFLHLLDLAETSAAVASKRKCTSSEVVTVAQQKLYKNEFSKFLRLYRSFFFFDPYQVIYQNSLLATQELTEPQQFNKKGEYPFDGYFAAREILGKKLKGNEPFADAVLSAHYALVSKESITQEHVAQMKGYSPRNSEGALDEHLGKFRSRCGYFQEGMNELTQENQITLSDGSPLRAEGRKLKEVLLENSYLHPEEASGNSDKRRISYPCITDVASIDQILKNHRMNLSQKLMDRLKEVRSQLHKESQSQENKAASINHNDDAGFQRLQRQLVRELLSYEFTVLKKRLSRSHGNAEKVIEATAKFIHSFISIHPFLNGNGRIARLLTELIFEEYGINPPLMLYWGQDILLGKESFVRLMRDAVLLSDRMHADACDHFEGINSLDISSLFDLKDKKVGLQDYLNWARRTNAGTMIGSKKPALYVEGDMKKVTEPIRRAFAGS